MVSDCVRGNKFDKVCGDYVVGEYNKVIVDFELVELGMNIGDVIGNIVSNVFGEVFGDVFIDI